MKPVNHPLPIRPADDPNPAPEGPALARLAQLIQAYTPYDGRHELRLPGVSVARRSHINTELVHTSYRPSLCVVAQGAKRVFVGSEVYDYDAARLLVVSVDLPVASQLIRASFTEPFLSLTLDLDPARLAALALRVFPHGLPNVRDARGMCAGQADTGIVKAAARLLELMADRADAELIAPLALDELLIRLLRSPAGGRVAQLGQANSGVQRIARAVEWVRTHYDQPVNVDTLASTVHMSPSSFHEHFKAVTSMSPLQYQKVLRLREARRLMLTSSMDAGTAGRQVGYASASQFTREYSRLFGDAPTRDIAHLRTHSGTPSAVI